MHGLRSTSLVYLDDLGDSASLSPCPELLEHSDDDTDSNLRKERCVDCKLVLIGLELVDIRYRSLRNTAAPSLMDRRKPRSLVRLRHALGGRQVMAMTWHLGAVVSVKWIQLTPSNLRTAATTLSRTPGPTFISPILWTSLTIPERVWRASAAVSAVRVRRTLSSCQGENGSFRRRASLASREGERWSLAGRGGRARRA